MTLTTMMLVDAIEKGGPGSGPHPGSGSKKDDKKGHGRPGGLLNAKEIKSIRNGAGNAVPTDRPSGKEINQIHGALLENGFSHQISTKVQIGPNSGSIHTYYTHPSGASAFIHNKGGNATIYNPRVKGVAVGQPRFNLGLHATPYNKTSYNVSPSEVSSVMAGKVKH